MLDQKSQCVSIGLRQQIDGSVQIAYGLIIVDILDGIRKVLPQIRRNNRLTEAAQEIFDATADNVDVDVRQWWNGLAT